MYKVEISKKAIGKIGKYISKYREYHQDLYIDSGIWSEDLIVDGYEKEAKNRYHEIRTLLEQKTSQELPSYPNNIALIHWRTKILLVTFRQKENNTRIITDIEIR